MTDIIIETPNGFEVWHERADLERVTTNALGSRIEIDVNGECWLVDYDDPIHVCHDCRIEATDHKYCRACQVKRWADEYPTNTSDTIPDCPGCPEPF